MTKQQWQQCFEPTPDDFRACVRRALNNKEDVKVKRVIPRALALALVMVCLLASVALAAGLGVLDFLKVDNVGDLKVATPTATGTDMQLVTAQVREAVCDGLSAHVVVAYTTKSADDALINEFDQEKLEKDQMEFSSAMKTAKRVLILGYNDMVTDGTEISLQAGYNWKYESARTLVIDYVIDLREYIRMMLDDDGNMSVLPLSVGDTLTLHLQPWVLDAKWETLEKGDISLTLDVPKSNAESWKAKNLPIACDQYEITSVEIKRTEMACYMTLSLRDPLGGESESPMQGSLWFKAVDDKGEAYALLNGGYKVSLNGEGGSQLVVIFLQRFEPGDMLRIQPYDSGTKQTWDIIEIPLVKE